MNDFIYGNDWLNRQPPYAFKIDHLLFIYLGLGLGAIAAYFLRGKSKKTIEAVMISLWGFGTAVVFAYYITIWVNSAIDPVNHPFRLEGDLPLHSCLMFMYVFPLAVFPKNLAVRKAASNFLVIVNMIMGFITLFVGCPPAGSSALSFVGIQSMIIHIIIVVVPIIMLVTNYYDLRKADVEGGLIIFLILGTAIWMFDHFAKCDYFYFYDGHTFPVLKVISENVPHWVWTIIVVTCYVLTAIIVHFSIVGIKTLIERKKAKDAEPAPQEGTEDNKK